MRVSELAKELGYKAAELVALAQAKGVKIEDIRADIGARLAAAIRAQIPHRSKLSGALRDAYAAFLAGEAARAAAKAAEPKPEKPKKEPPAEGAAPVRRAPRKKVVKDPAVTAKEGPKAAPAAAKPAKKTRVVEEFRLSDAQKPAPAKPAAHKTVELSPEEQAELKKEAAKPLIDVDRVIGVPKELHAMRPIEIEVYQRDAGVEVHKDKRLPRTVDDKDKRALRPAGKAPLTASSPSARPSPAARPGAAPVPDIRRPKPRVPPPAMRPTVAPPRPRPVVAPMAERKIEVTVPISIKGFCEQTGIKVGLVMKKLIEQGVMATINQSLDEESVMVLAAEFKRDITVVKEKTAEEQMKAVSEVKDDPKDQIPRAPVVTFMGHVDHGKTSLLDRIRNTNVAAGESGGITQHIAAWKVVTKDGKSVVFLDTPGHEAFTQMRSRGARVTDVAVIVVAADDGVMPQTEEAINHAKAAGVKIVIALNKCDKPQANPNRVKGQLAALGLQTEDWGGNIVCVEVSALTGQGVDHLVEMLSLEAELMELKANPKRDASGVVIEARKTEGRGVVATLLVQNGTLRKGDMILAGRGYGRVRALQDHALQTVPEAGPSTPVEVAGLEEVPDAGDAFAVVRDAAQAKEVAEQRRYQAREAQLQERRHITIENLFKNIESGQLKEVRVILKVDVKGSLEVLKQALPNLSTGEVKLRILHASLGVVNESDILLADASDAIVIGFHVDVEDRARDMAKERGIEVRVYTVIYQAIDEMKAALEGLLEPEVVETKQGRAGVKEVFRISRVGTVAGCIVTEGKIERANPVRVVRDGKVVHTGKLESLKRFKDDVKEVVAGYECGIKVAGHDDIRAGDIFESYAVQKIARKLSKQG